MKCHIPVKRDQVGAYIEKTKLLPLSAPVDLRVQKNKETKQTKQRYTRTLAQSGQ